MFAVSLSCIGAGDWCNEVIDLLRDGPRFKLMRNVQMLIDAHALGIQLERKWMPELEAFPSWVAQQHPKKTINLDKPV